jgi:GntR family transcriptional regulator, transcriptional repressor for pyruvate dehydrogenase complex
MTAAIDDGVDRLAYSLAQETWLSRRNGTWFEVDRPMGRRAKPTHVTARPEDAEPGTGLGEQVVNRILELVRTGNLRPGDRLPPERELIEIFGISRPSLREALRSLSILGVIAVRHGGGAFVSDLDARTLLAPLDFFMSLSTSNLADAFDCRRVVEMEIVRRTALAATRKDRGEFADMIGAHASVLDDPVGFRILDSRFHEKLYATAGNAVLHRMANGLYNLGLDLRRRATAEFGAIQRSAADPEGAAQAMKDHLHHIEESTRRMMLLEAAEEQARIRQAS